MPIPSLRRGDSERVLANLLISGLRVPGPSRTPLREGIVREESSAALFLNNAHPRPHHLERLDLAFTGRHPVDRERDTATRASQIASSAYAGAAKGCAASRVKATRLCDIPQTPATSPLPAHDNGARQLVCREPWLDTSTFGSVPRQLLVPVCDSHP